MGIPSQKRLALFMTLPLKIRASGSKQIYQVGQTQAQIESLTLHGAKRQGIARNREFAYSFGRKLFTILVTGLALHPLDHSRPRRQGLPTSLEAAGAKRTGRVDDVVANFRVRAAHSAIELSIENNPAADSGPDGHIDELRLTFPGAQLASAKAAASASFSSATCTRKRFAKSSTRHSPLHFRKKIHVTEPSGKRIHGAGRSNTDTGEFHSRRLRGAS